MSHHGFTKQLDQLRNRLKVGIGVRISSTNTEGWELSLVTESNHYPYWLRWEGKTLEKALTFCLAYLDGKVTQPHGITKVPAEAWQADTQ